MTVLFEVSWPLQLKPKFEVLPLWYGFTWLCFRVAFLRINMERFCGDWAVGAAFGRRDPVYGNVTLAIARSWVPAGP